MPRTRPKKVYSGEEALQLFHELYVADDVSENGDFDGEPMELNSESEDSDTDSFYEYLARPRPQPGQARALDSGDDSDVGSEADFEEEDHPHSDHDDDDLDVIDDGIFDAAWLMAFNERVGPVLQDPEATAYEVFSDFLTDRVVHHLEVETNRYADQYFQRLGGKENLPPHSRARHWKPVNSQDIRAVIGVILYAGLMKLPNYNLIWSSHSLLDLGIRKSISRNKFMRVFSFLHASNNENMPRNDDANRDRLFKIRPVWDMFVERWQSAFHPGREISIDETIIPFKGRSSWVKYQPKKPHKWGFVVWSLCDSKAGYVLNWKMAGDKFGVAEDAEKGVMHNVVMNVSRPYLGKGHHLFMDNLFSSPILFDELGENSTGACGTLRVNRRGVPETIKRGRPKKGEPPVSLKEGNNMFISWMDKKPVNLISSLHNDAVMDKRVRRKREVVTIQKPTAINEYNKFMGGVDLADQLAFHCLNLHRCTKWWKKLLIALLEVSVCNTIVILRQNLTAAQRKKIDPNDVRLKIISGLLAGCNKSSHGGGGKRVEDDQCPGRFMDPNTHFPSPNPKRLPSGRQSAPDCVVCSQRPGKRHQTTTVCRKCGTVPMCMYPCFKRFHTLRHYKVRCNPQLHEAEPVSD